jgi:hypothetical protein
VPHIKSALALVVAVGLPAGAQTFIQQSADKCFTVDSTVYRLVSRPDPAAYAVHVAADVAQPDLTVHLTDNPDTADFILVDDRDNGEQAACRNSPRPIRPINVNRQTQRPDLTVALSPASVPADYELYVRSESFSVEEAAALFATMVRSAGSPRAAATAVDR